MWNKLQNLSNHPVMRFFLKLLGDPIRLYAVFLITTVMYYYHANMTAIYTVFAVLISFVLMKLYDFIAKHKYLGILIYLVYMFTGLEIVGMLAKRCVFFVLLYHCNLFINARIFNKCCILFFKN